MNLLQSSKLFCFIKNIYLVLYNGVVSSKAAKVFTTVVSWFNESLLYRAIIKIVLGIYACFQGSFIYRIIYRKDNERSYMDSSLIMSLCCRIINFITGGLSALYNKIKTVNTGSVNNRVFLFFRNTFSLSFENILSGVMILIVIVPASMWNNLYGLLIAVMLAGIYFIGCISDKRYSLNIKGIGFAMLVFMFASLYAVAVSLEIKDSIRVFLFFATSFIYMLAVGGSMNTEEKLNRFLGFIYIGVILTAIICICQAVLGVEADARLVDKTTSGDIRRAFSTFENPNNYAEYLVLFLPFMAAYALNKKENSEKTLYLGMLIIPVVALVLTYSRSCWVTFAISAVVFIILYDYKLIPYLLLAGILAIPFLPDSVWRRILTIGSLSDSSNMYRVEIWSGCLRMLKEWGIRGLGLGPAAFADVYPSYAQAAAITAPHSHMLFLEIILEMGIIGFVSFLFWWISTIKRMLTPVVRGDVNGRMVKNVLIAAVSSLTAITFVSGVEYIWFYPRVMMMFFVAAGIMIAALNILRKE